MIIQPTIQSSGGNPFSTQEGIKEDGASFVLERTPQLPELCRKWSLSPLNQYKPSMHT